MIATIARPGEFLAAFKSACLVPPAPDREWTQHVLLDLRDSAALRSADGRGNRLAIPVPGLVSGDEQPFPLPRVKVAQVLATAGGKPVTIARVRIPATRAAKAHVVLRLESSSGRWDLPWFDPAEYPVPDDDGFPEDLASVARDDLANLIERTLFATDDRDQRYALGCVAPSIAAGRLRFAATDGRRIALAAAPCNVVGSGGFPGPEGLGASLMPVAGLKVLRGLLPLCEVDAEVEHERKAVVFSLAAREFSEALARLPDGDAVELRTYGEKDPVRVTSADGSFEVVQMTLTRLPSMLTTPIAPAREGALA